MASLIKNQILKHLSKFAKNLSPDQINLSTFKGEGELTNLELNEAVLMDLLELPTWLKLTKAICNKVNIKIQWTKLKSVPLSVYLDEVIVVMETTEQLRQVNPHATRPSYSSGGKYGFSDSVIDGMMVNINSVEIKFTSSAFHASFQLSRLRLESRNPNWHRSDLRMTRLKDPDRGELLIFKELEWQTLRIEAAASDPKSAFTTPLRLITNQARCRITVKKRLIDCGLLASRMMLILDDLLWVLTDTQIQAALHFLSSLSGLIRKAAEVEKRIKAAQKLESMPSQNQLSQLSARASGRAQNNVAKAFNMYDIVETSIHVYSSRIDLHFCDDAKPEEDRSSHKLLSDGAAMQVTLTKLAVDYYPYHFAFGDRKHWLRYNEANTPHAAWVEQLMAVYRQQLMELVSGEAPRSSSPRQRSPSHGQPTSPQSQEDRRRSSGQSKAAVVATFLKSLMSSCLVLRLDDFVIYQVSTTETRKRVPEKFLSSDKGRLMLPASMPAVHVEFTEYYFPGDDVFPVPVANVHTHANPVQITVDMLTVLWLNSFILSLEKSHVLNSIYTVGRVLPVPDVVRPVDIRLEALMPRIVIPATKEYTNQPDRPKSLQIQISRLVATNCRIGENCGLPHLQNCLETFQNGTLFLDKNFPVEEGDLNPLHEAFYLHSLGEDSIEPSPPFSNTPDAVWSESSKPDSQDRTPGGSGSDDAPSALRKDLLWTDNKSVWCVQLEPVWVDFCGMESCKNRPSPFVDAVQATFWIVQNIWCPGSRQSQPPSPARGVEDVVDDTLSVYVLAQFRSLVSVQLNHFQYLFLLRAAERLDEIGTHLAADADAIRGRKNSTRMCAALIVPEVDVSLVVPVKMAKGSDGAGETESLGGDLSSSAATTGALDRVDSAGNLARTASATFSMRESLSDNHIGLGGGATEHLTASCSDYSLGNAKGLGASQENVAGVKESATFRKCEVADGFAEDRERRRDRNPVRDVQPSLPNGSVVSGDKTGAGAKGPTLPNPAVTHKIAGFFAQQGHSRSVDIFSAPLLEMASFENVPDKLGKTFASGSSAMKKGFSNLVASFDSALSTPKSPTPVTSPNPPTDVQSFHSGDSYAGDDFDSMSLCSDLSDSDQFVLLNSENSFIDENLLSAGGQDPSVIEVASEVKEDSSSEQSVASSFKRQDLMQVVTFRLGIVEAVQQSKGRDVISKMKAEYLHSEELGTMTWEEFQAKFSAGARVWQEEAIKYTLPACDVRARFQKGPMNKHICEEAEERGFLEARLSDASLSLLMSTVASLTDLLEDEVIPVPIPMKLLVNDVKLSLQEDRPSSNITSPGPIPISVAVNNLIVTRTPDGTFQILPGVPPDGASTAGTSSAEAGTQTDAYDESQRALERADSTGEGRNRRRRPSLEDLDEKVFILQEENERLRLKLLALEAAQRDCRLRRASEEEDPRSLPAAAEEKQALLAGMQMLRHKMAASEEARTAGQEPALPAPI